MTENNIYDLQFGFRQKFSASRALINLQGISNNWFKSYLSNRKQFVSINGYDSGLAEIKYGVPQGSVLGPLLFLLYINDLNQAIKFCKVHHFADDTNLLYVGKSIKELNKLVNYDLKNLLHWLNANSISLNVKKTELVIFKSKWKQFNGEIKLKLSHKRLFLTKILTNNITFLNVLVNIG